MSPITSPPSGQTDIRVGNIVNAKGVTIGNNSQTNVYEGLTTEQVATLVVELKNRDQPIV